MTTILGFHNDEDAGAALLIDGKIAGAVNEERFTRVKLSKGFPSRSIEFLLQSSGLRWEGIDHFVYGWFSGNNAHEVLPKIVSRAMLNAEDPIAADIIRQRLEVEYARDQETRNLAVAELQAKGVPLHKLITIEHHPAHAWSAFATSPFDRALVITADGRGDYKSATVSVADAKTGLQEVSWLSSLDSLGFLYGQITGYLGFKPCRHEGKITGLAAFGDPSKTRSLFDSLMTWKQGQIFANIGSLYRPFYTHLSWQLLEALKPYSPEDIAAGLQQQTEYLMTRFVEESLKKYPYENVCLAGGIFGNVRVNQCIREISGVKNVYIHPQMGDGGLSLGSAIAHQFKLTGQTHLDMPTVYLGPEYSDEEIYQELRCHEKLRYQRMVNQPALVSQLLQHNKIIGYFDGKMEYGPRALGHRSILCNPKDKTINDWLNRRLARTEFMPFAPVVIEDLARLCFVGWEPSHTAAHFMTTTYHCTPLFKENSPAVVHVDGTARPQIIVREHNPGYYAIVKRYYDDTGTLSCINTSFNRHEEPIVCSPRDAVQALLENSVDVLVIGNYLVERSK